MGRFHMIRVQFPSGKTFERESGHAHPGRAARMAVVGSYTDHKLYNPAKMDSLGNQRVDMEELSRLPAGWGKMSEDEQYAIAVAAGYKPVAVAWYKNQKLVWHSEWNEERP